MKKLLLMGEDSSTRFAIEYAKRKGIHTIFTDYKTPEENPLKLLTDEYWMLNVNDLDVLEQKCKEEKIDGVYAGNHEYCLDMTRALCKRLGLPFYASDEGWETARDKARFKQHCINSGIDVAHWYHVDASFDEKVMSEIVYPVVVKPTDASSQRGFSICYNENELRRDYERALSFSEKGEVLVEQFVEGPEVDIIYYVDEGTPHLIVINDKLMKLVNGRMNQTVLPNQSIFYDDYVKNVAPNAAKLIGNLGIKNGTLFFQAICSGGKYYFLEMGCRLDGIGTWTNMAPLYGVNYVEYMVDLAIGERPSINWDELNLSPKGKHSFIYLFWAKSGHISEVKGLDELHAAEGITFALERFKAGDEVKKTDDLHQVAWYIGVNAKSGEALADKLKYVNETLLLLDENGENLMLTYDDYESVRSTY